MKVAAVTVANDETSRACAHKDLRGTVSDVLFRELVDEVVRTTALPNIESLEALYARYGLEGGDGCYQRDAVTSHLRTQIPRALDRGKGWEVRDLRALERQLILRHELAKTPLHPALEILDVIIEELRFAKRQRPEHATNIAPLKRSDQWLSAIRSAWESLHISPRPDLQEDQHVRRMHWRAFCTAEQARVLQDLGFKVKAIRGQTVVRHDELDRIWSEITDGIKRLGAVSVAAHIFGNLIYDGEQDRYHLPRMVGTRPDNSKPSIPIAYLLNLSVQQLSPTPAATIPEKEAKAIWNRISELATALFAIYDVQSYSVFEELFHNPRTLVEFLRSHAIYDSAVLIGQIRSADVLPFLSGVFDWVDEKKMVATVGWTLANALSVIKGILDKAGQTRGPIVFNIEQLASKCSDVPRAAFDSVIAAMTHYKCINETFKLPNDIIRTDFWKKPLIEFGAGFALLMDVRWCSPSFYEAIATITRSIWGADADKQIGQAAERFAKQAFLSHGIRALAGQYRDKTGECDLIVETSNVVIFAELKKKALT